MNGALKDDKNAFKELLLAEYNYLTNMFLSNEKMGEKRISFFITLVTAGLTIILTLTSEGVILIDSYSAVFLFLAGVFILILIGLITFKRIVVRNITSDEIKDKVDNIRKYFVEKDSKEIEYLPFDPYSKGPKRKPLRVFSLGTGGLLQTVILMNSIILCVSIVWILILIPLSLIPLIQNITIGVLGIAGFIISWVCQIIYARKCYEKKRKHDK